jgi:hypothetical protein
LGTVPGTSAAFSSRCVQKTEGKRGKATVSLTVAFFDKPVGQGDGHTTVALWTIDQRLIEHDGIRNGSLC